MTVKLLRKKVEDQEQTIHRLTNEGLVEQMDTDECSSSRDVRDSDSGALRGGGSALRGGGMAPRGGASSMGV